jgi:formate hydrogenlyase subunit 4
MTGPEPLTTIVLVLLQVCVLGGLAPLVTGTIRATKARLQTRRGPSIWQPYRDLRKWWSKETVESSVGGPVQRHAPPVVLGAIVAAAALVPTIAARAPLDRWGDLLAVIGLLALSRFALALAALDAGSAFGGMASSREVAIAALIEPGLVLALVAAAAAAGSTDLGAIAANGAARGLDLLTPSHALAAAAFAIVVLADTGHLPVDNPDTHLELTMVHEGMLLEASGRRLALLMLAAHLRQALLLALFLAAFAPWAMASTLSVGPVALGIAAFAIKLLVAGQGLALADAGLPKLRILRLPAFIGVAAMLALVALAAQIWLPA